MASVLGSAKPELAIVGAGLGGVTLSIALSRVGVAHKIYESAQGFSEIGAGISMLPNALQALTLIEPKLKDWIERETTWNRSLERRGTTIVYKAGMAQMKSGAKYVRCYFISMSEKADERTLFRFGDTIHNLEGPSWYPVGRRCVRRDRLLGELARHIPNGTVQFKKSLVDVRQSGPRYELVFADGSCANADAVVGCDGIKSKTKRFVLGKGDPALEPAFTKSFAYRGLVPRGLAEDLLGPDISNLVIHQGYNAYVVSYPVSDDIINVGAFCKPDRQANWSNEKWVVSGSKEEMLKHFEGFGEPLRKLLDHFEDTSKWGIFDTLPARTYASGRICVLGDAAHATSPHHGSGAGMAYEDAYVLAGLLSNVSRSEDIEAAFQVFDEVRRPRTQAIVTSSRDMGDLNCFSLPGVEDDFEKIATLTNRRFGRIWDFDLKRELDRAKSIMQSKVSR